MRFFRRERKRSRRYESKNLPGSGSGFCNYCGGGGGVHHHAGFQYTYIYYQVVSDNSLYDVDSETLLNAIGQGVVSGIGDPYAEYYSSSEYQKLLDEQSGDAVGIGVLLQEDSSGDYAAVVQVYPDSPAESAGLQPGDLILEVDGNSRCGGMELEEVSDALIGEKGHGGELGVPAKRQ